MRVLHIVALSDEHVVVHLRPVWLARLFGSPDLVVELVWSLAEDAREDGDGARGWVGRYSRKRIAFMEYSTLLRHALDHHPLEHPPPARLIKER